MWGWGRWFYKKGAGLFNNTLYM